MNVPELEVQEGGQKLSRVVKWWSLSGEGVRSIQSSYVSLFVVLEINSFRNNRYGLYKVP